MVYFYKYFYGYKIICIYSRKFRKYRKYKIMFNLFHPEITYVNKFYVFPFSIFFYSISPKKLDLYSVQFCKLLVSLSLINIL